MLIPGTHSQAITSEVRPIHQYFFFQYVYVYLYTPTCTPILPAATRLKQPEHMEGGARSPNLLGPTCPGMVLWWRRKHPRSEVIGVGSGSMTSGTHVTPKHLLHQGNEEPQPFPSGWSRESNELTQAGDQPQEPGGLVPRDEHQPLPAGQP